jgi:hypothetical protein
MDGGLARFVHPVELTISKSAASEKNTPRNKGILLEESHKVQKTSPLQTIGGGWKL